MSEKKAPEESGAASGGGGGNKIVMIIAFVNLLATLGIGVVSFLSFKKEQERSTVSKVASDAGGEHGAEAGGEHGGGGEHGAPAEHGAPSEHGGGVLSLKTKRYSKMITLEQFTVNLTTSGSSVPKYVRVNVAIELANDEMEAEINQKLPQVRSTVIDLINAKRPTDLSSVQGRDFLKEEIRTAINSFLVTGKIKGVYFANWVMST